MNKGEYEKLKEAAIEDLINGPKETALKCWKREKIYKEAFDRVLKRDGVVTGESLAKELDKDETFDNIEKKRIYISGPISGHDIEERRKAFKKVELMLQAQGYEPVNPMENGISQDADVHDHMRRDIELLMTCDYIYLMRKWTHSKGCMVELEVATSIGLPVIFEESADIIKFI